MKERAPREAQGDSRAAARAPAAKAAGDRVGADQDGAQPADALAHSPVLAAQRRRMAQLLDEGRRPRPAQRVRARPTEDELRTRIGAYISNVKGECRDQAVEVYRALRETVDADDEIRVALVEWAENYGSADFDVGNHMAVLVTWAEGTFVVDTTAGQFGAEDLVVLPADEWVDLVTGLQHVPVSHVRYEALPSAPTGTGMGWRTNNMYMELLHAMPRPGGEEHAPHAQDGAHAHEAHAQPGGGTGRRRRGRKCFLTSACVQWRGLPDDCPELQALRAFRDGWMQALPEGPALIEEYYALAPALVDAIEARPDAAAHYACIYASVRGCLAQIGRGRPRAALQAYIDMVRGLQARLLPATANAI